MSSPGAHFQAVIGTKLPYRRNPGSHFSHAFKPPSSISFGVEGLKDGAMKPPVVSDHLGKAFFLLDSIIGFGHL
jgi:hypothetical protein